jgi:hypothetical protein
VHLLESIEKDANLTLIIAQLRPAGTGPSSYSSDQGLLGQGETRLLARQHPAVVSFPQTRPGWE